MIIRLKPKEDLERLAEKLRLVPEEKRRVLILVGRHRNEGTHLIARQHHKEWEEAGAVVVQIPFKWTPQGFWNNALKLGEKAGVNVTGKSIQVRNIFKFIDHVHQIPTDQNVLAFLFENGFHVPIINFHGSPSNNSGWPTNLQQYKASTSSVQLSAHCIYKCSSHNELLVEYSYRGRTQKYPWHNLREIHFPMLRQLAAAYLYFNKVTKDALATFTREHNSKFVSFVKELAEKGLKKEKST